MKGFAGFAGRLRAVSASTFRRNKRGSARAHLVYKPVEHLEARVLLARVEGIDVSQFQGTIDWNQVRDAGKEFAFVRSTIGNSTNSPNIDTKLHANMSGGASAGLLMGVYHRAKPDATANDAVHEATWFLQNAQQYMTAGWLRPVVDIEHTDVGGLNQAAVSAWVNTFSDTVEAAIGVPPIVYGNTTTATNLLDTGVAAGHELWLARYNTGTVNPQIDQPQTPSGFPNPYGSWNVPVGSTTPSHDSWSFWQYTNQATLPGITENFVDLNVFQGDRAALESQFVFAQPAAKFQATINFGPYESAVPSGYVNFANQTFSPVLGYQMGWDSAGAQAYAPAGGSPPDERYRGYVMPNALGVSRSFEIAVPDGSYRVRVVAGSPTEYGNTHKFWVETPISGTPILSGVNNSVNHYLSGVQTVTVSDGRLTISSDYNTAPNSRLMFVDIVDASRTGSPPAAPAEVAATPASSTSVDLRWLDQGDNEGRDPTSGFGPSTWGQVNEGYKVERRQFTNGVWSAWTTLSRHARANAEAFQDTGLSPGAQYQYRISAVNGAGGSVGVLSPTVTTPAVDGQQAYSATGTPWTVGAVIQAEEFDRGGQGVAFNDLSTGNAGGFYRNSGMDVGRIGDLQSGLPAEPRAHRVGWFRPNEWVEYTVDVPAAGEYVMQFHISVPGDGATFHATTAQAGGAEINLAGPGTSATWAVPNTGNWDAFTTVAKVVTLSRGEQVIRVYADTNVSTNPGVMDFDWFRIDPLVSAQIDLDVDGVAEGNESSVGGWVVMNSNYNEMNFAANGKRRHDHEQDWDSVNRRYVDKAVATDGDLRNVTLTMGAAGQSGTWKLEFSDRIRVWKDNGDGTLTQIISGATQAAVNGLVTLNLKVEGVRLSQLTNDIELKATYNSSFGGGPVSTSARLSVANVDIDIDTDNNNGFDLPDSTMDEGLLEEEVDQPGKILAINDDDDNSNGRPDYADGFSGIGGTAGEQFVPMIIQLPRPINLSLTKLKFEYDEANPASVSQDGSGNWSPGTGKLRLWKKDGYEVRNGASVGAGGDFIDEGEYSPAQIGVTTDRETPIWIEATGATTADLASRSIKLWGDPDGPGPAGFVLFEYALVTVTGDGVSIATPTGLTAEMVNGTTVDLDWNDNPEPGVTYKLYRSTTSGFTPDDATNLVDSGISLSEYTDATLPAPGVYYYKVRAVVGTTQSAPSAQARVDTRQPPSVPAHGWYHNDFETGTSAGLEWSHRNMERTPLQDRGFLGQFNKDTVTLSLDQLPAHTSVTVAFDFYCILSWDGGSGDYGPDTWAFTVDGIQEPFVDHYFVNKYNYAYPHPADRVAPTYVADGDEIDSFGYWYDVPRSTVYHFSFTFPHTADTITLRFAGSPAESIYDESWGIDNIHVTSGAPARPDGLIAVPRANNTIALDWEPNTESDLAGYRIYRKVPTAPHPNWKWQLLTEQLLPPTTTEYVDDDLPPDTWVYYKLVAVNNSGGESGEPAEVMAQTSAVSSTPPATPTGLTGLTLSSREISLDWNDLTPAPNGYHVYRLAEGGKGYERIAHTTASSYADSNLTPSTKYTYRVTAVNAERNESLPSLPVTKTTASSTTPKPATPTGLTVTAVSDSRIELNWDDASDPNVDGFRVYRFEPESQQYKLIFAGTASQISDGGLDYSRAYHYRVVAVNDDVESDPAFGSAFTKSPQLSVSASPTSVQEGGTNPAKFRIQLSRPADRDVQVYYTIGGSGLVNEDYNPLPAGAVIPKGQSFVDIEVTAVNDLEEEANKTVTLRLEQGGDYKVAEPPDNAATIIILDDDSSGTPGVPTVAVEATDPIGIEAADPIEFVFSRSGIATDALVVNYGIAGTATNGVDYPQLSGKVTFAPGQSSKVVPISPKPDADVEGDETIEITLLPGDDPAAYTIGSQDSDVATITNAPPPPDQQPSLKLTQPVNGETLTRDTSIQGIIDDLNDDLERWTLTLVSTKDASFSQIIARKDVDLGDTDLERGYWGGASVDLGIISVTSLPDGIYKLVLSAEDALGQTATLPTGQEPTFTVQTNVKAGSFNLPATDLAIPVPGGQPITISRVYDSTYANRNGEDFGYGWRWDLRDSQVEGTELDPAVTGSPLRSDTVGLRAGDVVRVAIPGGRSIPFVFAPELTAAHFYAADGSAAKLNLYNRDLSEVYLYPPGTIGSGDTDEYAADSLVGSSSFVTAFNPASFYFGGGYRVTMPDGTEYRVKYNVQQQKGRVETVRDANGNQLSVTPTAVTSNGLTVTIERDGASRIKRVRDLANNSIDFVYDPNTGDLLGVVDRHTLVEDASDNLVPGPRPVTTYAYADRLVVPYEPGPGEGIEAVIRNSSGTELQRVTLAAVAHEDGVTSTTRWFVGGLPTGLPLTYGAAFDVEYVVAGTSNVVWSEQRAWQPARPHFLVGVIDPRGVKTFSARYDLGSGGLVELTDAFGEQLPVTTGGFDGNTAEQKVTDPEQNLTEYVSNRYGDVIRQISRVREAGGGAFVWSVRVTNYSRGDEGELTEVIEYEAFEVTEPESGTARKTQAPVANSWTTKRTFYSDRTSDDFGQLHTQLLPPAPGETADRTTTFSEYVLGKPRKVIDADGNVTRSQYDDTGNLLEVKRYEGSDTTGRLVEKTVTQYSHSLDGSGQWLRPDLPKGVLLKVIRFEEPETLQERPVIVTQNDYYDSTQPGTAAFLDDRLRSSQDAAGVVSYLVYDQSGQQTVSYRHWEDRTDGDTAIDKTVVSRTDYDPAGRAVRSSQYTLSGEQNFTSASELDAFTADSSALTLYSVAGQSFRTTDRFGGVTEMRYDLRGNVVETRTQTKLQDGTVAWRVTRTAYDKNGRAIAVTDPFLVADGPGEAVLTATADLRVTHSIYDAKGQIFESRRLAGLGISVAPADGDYTVPLFASTFDLTYDDATGWEGNHLLSRTATSFDEAGRMRSSTDATGVTTYYEYFEDGSERAVTTPAHFAADGTTVTAFHRVEYGYDAQGRQWSVTENVRQGVASDGIPDTANVDRSGARTTFYEYDVQGRQTAVVMPAIDDVDNPGTPVRARTEYEYDDQGRRRVVIEDLKQLLNPAAFASAAAYAAAFDPTNPAHVDRSGARRTDHEYDDLGRLRTVTLPAVERGTATVRPLYEYDYDVFGSRILIRDPEDNDHDYSAAGYTGNSLNKENGFTFDHAGRQLSRTLPLGQTEYMIYDDRPLGSVSGSLAASTALGQLAYAVDFEGRITAYLYDNTSSGGGRLVEKRHYAKVAGFTPSAGLTPAAMQTALAGEVPEQTITQLYDGFGRVTSVTQSFSGGVPSRTEVMTYDTDGRVTSRTTSEGSVRHEYDVLGRLTRTYTGSADVDKTSTTSDGKAVTDTRYVYNALGQLIRVESHERFDTPLAAPEVMTYGYTLDGALDYEHLPAKNGSANPVVKDYVYDALGRVDALSHFIDADSDHAHDVGEALLLGQDYAYRLSYSPVSLAEVYHDATTGSFTWTYDGMDRLTGESFTGTDASGNALTYADTYTLDLASNRLTKAHVGTDGDYTTAYAYDADDRLGTDTTDAVDNTKDRHTVYAYGPTDQTGKTVYAGLDANGTKLSGTTFAYDAAGRMKKVEIDTDGDGEVDQTLEYAYDANGIRISQVVDGVTTRYLVDTQNPTGHAQVLEEKDAAGNVIKTYTIGLDVVAQAAAAAVAYVNGQSQQATLPAKAAAYLLADAHGSTRAIVDLAASVLQRYSYDAYGKPLGHSELGALTSLLYGGEWTQAQTGLQYLRARWYDPANGRFGRRDPFGGSADLPLTFHPYIYGLQNPVLHVDPSGQIPPFVVALLWPLLSYMTGVVVNYAIGKAVSAGTSYLMNGDFRDFHWFEKWDLLSLIPGSAFTAGGRLVMSIGGGAGKAVGHGIAGLASLAASLLTKQGSKLVGKHAHRGAATAAAVVQRFGNAAGNLVFKTKGGAEWTVDEERFLHFLHRHVSQFYEDKLKKTATTSFWPTGTTASDIMAHLDEATALLPDKVPAGGWFVVHLDAERTVRFYLEPTAGAAGGRITSFHPMKWPDMVPGSEILKLI